MGRQESLTSLALGRGPYEDEVLESSSDGSHSNGQRYSASGRPRNPETRRRERENVRAANEVMQVTGIVEDSLVARIKAKESLLNKNQETLAGLRFMEAGRAVLVAGVWGVLGFRRRILLYRPYSLIGISQLIQTERAQHSIDSLFFSGIPTVLAYHISDWLAFFVDTIIEAVFDDEDDEPFTPMQIKIKNCFRRVLDFTSCYVTLHFRLFAILQQLHLIPGSRLLPGFMSFIPFTATSPIALPPPVSLSIASVLQFGASIARTATPLLIILLHGKTKFLISRLIYRPIYKTMPRPTGDSMFSGMAISPPTLEFDAPDQDGSRGGTLGQDEATLRALEGLPHLERAETRTRPSDGVRDNSDDEDSEIAQATLISFDVEQTEAVESSLGTWSAELRSAHEPRPSKDVKYLVTGLTMLPPIMATEGMREVVAGILVMPLEAVMVRIIGRAFRRGEGLGIDDMWTVCPFFHTLSFKNLIPALGLQVVVTGVVWAGYSMGVYLWAQSQREKLEAEETFINGS